MPRKAVQDMMAEFMRAYGGGFLPLQRGVQRNKCVSEHDFVKSFQPAEFADHDFRAAHRRELKRIAGSKAAAYGFRCLQNFIS